MSLIGDLQTAYEGAGLKTSQIIPSIGPVITSELRSIYFPMSRPSDISWAVDSVPSGGFRKVVVDSDFERLLVEGVAPPSVDLQIEVRRQSPQSRHT